jgi:hypothetical protein
MASCLLDGRTRWIVEYDSYPFHFYRQVFVAGDGSVILSAGAIYRFDANGALLGRREIPMRGVPLGYSDACGLSFPRLVERPMDLFEQTGLTYLTGTNFESEHVLSFTLIPSEGLGDATSDCGMLEQGRVDGSFRLRRQSSAGGTVFDHDLKPRSNWMTIELEDRSLLVIYTGGSVPPAIQILDPTGLVRLDQTFDVSEVGEQFTYGAFALSEDGVLYVASSSGLGEVQQFVAIEIGMGPSVPYPGRAHYQVGLNWARTNATWTN